MWQTRLMGRFETLRIIDAQGDLVGEDPGLAPELYQEMYRNMVLARELDRRMLALQRQGRIGTYAMLEGQEAVQIGSALAMEPNDFVFPSYREHGVQITRGLPMEVLLAYWKGLPNADWDMEKYRMGVVTVPIATQIAHAVGYSYMSKLRNENTVTKKAVTENEKQYKFIEVRPAKFRKVGDKEKRNSRQVAEWVAIDPEPPPPRVTN
ncbi:MAG: thiamine pyrophosphate-dependent enzyme [Acidimicrobiia bacterium]